MLFPKDKAEQVEEYMFSFPVYFISSSCSAQRSVTLHYVRVLTSLLIKILLSEVFIYIFLAQSNLMSVREFPLILVGREAGP